VHDTGTDRWLALKLNGERLQEIAALRRVHRRGCGLNDQILVIVKAKRLRHLGGLLI